MSMSGAEGGLGVIEGEATDSKGLQRSVGFNGLFCIASRVQYPYVVGIPREEILMRREGEATSREYAGLEPCLLHSPQDFVGRTSEAE